MDFFQIYTHTLSRLWPVRLFAKTIDGEFEEIHKLDTASWAKLDAQGIYVYEVLENELVEKKETFSNRNLRFIKIKNISSIQGPIPFKHSQQLSIGDVMSLSEAARLWGLNDTSGLRKAMDRDKFYESEVKKADNIWLITYQAMQRVYEARTKKEIEEDIYPYLIVEGLKDGTFTPTFSEHLDEVEVQRPRSFESNKVEEGNEALHISIGSGKRDN